jgi:11-cis-retinol dehydrogenase
MFTGRLSDWFPGRRPGPYIQRANALLHQEPYSFLFYGIYWTLILMIGAPLVAASLSYFTLFQLIRYFVWKPRRIEPKENKESQLAVVITGCDSGFGQEVVFRLVAEGFVVFCGCLKQESMKQYGGEPLVIPLLLDVTNGKQVNESYYTVLKWLEDPRAEKKRFLHALVNNAGMGKGGYIDWTKLSDYFTCMDVNCFGMIRMVKAFLPIFKKQVVQNTYRDAQIMNVISMAGLLGNGGLAHSPYEVSKNAAEAFTDGLRLEMKMFGIKVVALNPSFHKTRKCFLCG